MGDKDEKNNRHGTRSGAVHRPVAEYEPVAGGPHAVDPYRHAFVRLAPGFEDRNILHAKKTALSSATVHDRAGFAGSTGL